MVENDIGDRQIHPEEGLLLGRRVDEAELLDTEAVHILIGIEVEEVANPIGVTEARILDGQGIHRYGLSDFSKSLKHHSILELSTILKRESIDLKPLGLSHNSISCVKIEDPIASTQDR